MSDNLIGLIILIAAINVFARIVRAASRATQRGRRGTAPAAPPGGPAAETDRGAGRPAEELPSAIDDGLFNWARDEEDAELSRAATTPAATDTEFAAHPETKWSLESTFEGQTPDSEWQGDFHDITTGWSDEIAEAPAQEDLTVVREANVVPARTAGIPAAIDRRWNAVQRLVIYSVIIEPCRAARRRPPHRIVP